MRVDTPRQGYEKFSGNTFQAYLNGLDALDLRPVVRLMVPEHVKRMMDTPPPPTAWVEGDELPLLFNAVVKVQGLEGCGPWATRPPAAPWAASSSRWCR